MTTLTKILKSVRNQRYAQDFEQEKKIGIGGYASVYKSKNLLDDQFYAVKKIKLKMKNLKQCMEEEIERVLQEVKVLAKVNHPNILRYYNSWLEVQCSEERKKSFELFDKKQLSPSNFVRKDQKLSLKSSRDYEAFDDQSEVEDDVVFSNEDESSQNNETREVDMNQRDYEDDLLEFTDESPTVLFEGREKKFQANDLKKKRNAEYGGDSSMSIFNSLKKVQIADKFAEFASKINREVEEPAKTKGANFQHYNHSFDDVKRNLKSSAENCIVLNRRHSSKSKVVREVLDLKDTKPLPAQKHPQSVKESKKDSGFEPDQLEGIKSITLYIQTELCNSTLEDYIIERNALLEKKKNDPEYNVLEERYLREAFKFAREIINGLEYIHTVCHMVHRDLKPSNILLTEDKGVKIGDFGLVKKMTSLSAFSPSPLSLSPIVSGVPTPDRNSFLDHQEKIEPFTLNKSNFENNCEFELKIDDDEKLSAAEEGSLGKGEFSFEDGLYNDGLINSPLISLPKVDGVDSLLLLNSPKNFTKDVGTKTFASPEQLSADSESFDERADIWSLGIIFLLLFHPMVTSMEQTRAIHNAKKGSLPSKFEDEQPVLAKIIKRMLSTEPNQRPYLKEIESELKKPNENLKKFFGKVKIRREGSSQWKERWLRITDNSALMFKRQTDKKADVVFNLSEWQVTLLNEKLKCNSLKSQENGSVINPSTLISIESQIQLGYEIAADDAPATLLLHKQITDN